MAERTNHPSPPSPTVYMYDNHSKKKHLHIWCHRLMFVVMVVVLRLGLYSRMEGGPLLQLLAIWLLIFLINSFLISFRFFLTLWQEF